jgi:phosphate transport system substrate-binding protein
LLWVVSLLFGCGGGTGGETAVSPALPATETAPAAAILVDGSSTVGPITSEMATVYREDNPDVTIEVAISGTGGGFKKFCAGETDISDASRPIKEAEMETCAANGVAFIELPVAFDGIAVMTNLDNEFVDCLTTGELETMWAQDAWQTVTNWRDVRPSFPDKPLTLYGPGAVSGTYDYFTEAIVGDEGESRPDFWANEDDDMLLQGIADDPTALGFFGLSYYERNRGQVKLLAVDHDDGCVKPNTETVARGLYQPLSRPLFIYVNRDRIDEKPALDPFLTYYLAHAPERVDDVGYVPLTEPLYELAEDRYENRVTGSVFAGSGAAVGVSLADLLMRER